MTYQVRNDGLGKNVPVLVALLETGVEENLHTRVSQELGKEDAMAQPYLRSTDCSRSDDEDLSSDVRRRGRVRILSIAQQVLDFRRADGELLVVRRGDRESGDAVVGEELEALALLLVDVDVLEDRVRGVPVHVVGVREPVAREREGLEAAVARGVGVLERAENEGVPDGFVEGVLVCPDQLLGGVVEAPPFAEVRLLVLLEHGQLQVWVEAWSGTRPVSLKMASERPTMQGERSEEREGSGRLGEKRE